MTGSRKRKNGKTSDGHRLYHSFTSELAKLDYVRYRTPAVKAAVCNVGELVDAVNEMRMQNEKQSSACLARCTQVIRC